MGYGGKLREQELARALRARAWTLADIAAELGVSKSSVSVWVRDVDFVPNPRRTARKRGPNKLQRAKSEEIEACRVAGLERFAQLTDDEFFAAGLGLYAGDGSKKGGSVNFANSNPDYIRFYCAWFRQFFDVEEARLRVQLYLHADLDLDSANGHWSRVTGIPLEQFHKPYRAVVDETRRHNRHVFGCCHVRYACTHTLRRILGMMDGLMLLPSSPVSPG
ncbi:MAG: helix-turn-helix domain-containing protein [Acidimicrobiales bacterium]|nr:helix-turn-helix domain-containing protein [Acidimicrobiales bacterium]